MNSKASKIIKKFLFLLPVGIILGMVIILWIEGIDPFHWQIGILVGVVLCLFYLLLNVKDYGSIEEMSIEDYLESNHQYKMTYDILVWEKFKTLIEHQFTNYKVHDYKPDEIIVKVENSIIKLKHNQIDLFLTIERKSFDFMPDRAGNYLLLKKIIKALNAPEQP